MSSKKSSYWKGVASRLASFGKAALNVAAPIAIEIGVETLISKACGKIELHLKQLYKRTAINSGITFLINLAGILFLALRPFGNKPSVITAVIFFTSATIFFLIRLILWCKSYGSQAIGVIKSIIHKKSIHTGIEEYVLKTFPYISLSYAGIDLGSMYVPALKNVPRIPQLIDFFVGYFWKRVALFFGIVVTYTIVVLWIGKPILINKYW